MRITAVKTMSETTRGLVRRQNWTATGWDATDSAYVLLWGGKRRRRPTARCFKIVPVVVEAAWLDGAWKPAILTHSTDLGRFEQALQVLEHALHVGIRGPSHHHIAIRVH